MNRILLATAILTAASGARSQDVVFRADRIVVAPGTVLEDGALAVRDGVVRHVGDEIPAEVHEAARTVQLDGTVVPGFIDPHDHLDQAGDLAERAMAFTPALRAADAFDPFDDAVAERARGGVTALGLAPTSTNTFGGIAAVVGTGADAGRLLVDDGYLKIALVRSARSNQRYPTSLMGAAEMIRDAFASARNPLAGNDTELAVLRDVLSGARHAVIHADTHAELTTALDLAEELAFAPVILGAREAEDHLERMRRLGVSVILAPLGFASERDRLELPALLAQTGIPFSFTCSHAEELRISAALAVRHGVPPETALAALTRTPAEQLESADRIGSLRVGRRADFLVFSGHPLDLTSRLRAVFVGGSALAPVETQ